jgi:manganese/zinc/iron transport system ATP- binding protein
MNNSTHAISINNLTVAYKEQKILHNMSVVIAAGSLVALVGPNGAGKSTLLKTMLGLIQPLTGTIHFFGKVLKTVRGTIAYIPQRSSIDWDFPLTVYDVVRMGRYARKNLFARLNAGDHERICDALVQVQLSEYAQTPINQLSGGQQQRVLLARALAQDADIYLLDEPFSAIDIATEKNIISLLGTLRNEGKTIVVVHHDVQTIADCFEWVLLLNRHTVMYGQVQHILKPEFLCTAYGPSIIMRSEQHD